MSAFSALRDRTASRWTIHVWQPVRRSLTAQRWRDDPRLLLPLAALIGAGAALAAVGLLTLLHALREISFGLPFDANLSGGEGLAWWRILAVPAAGGLLLGVAARLGRRWRRTDIVDAVEANALYGGRLSLRDSLQLAAATLMSGACGASVGLEAAYTQVGAALGSKFGRALKLRRDDVRLLVGCGAAGAIAAAFNAPLAGAFYAFELIIASYSAPALGPVTIAALSGTFTMRALVGSQPVFQLGTDIRLGSGDYPMFLLLGLGAAALGIVTMKGVTGTERWFRRRAIPTWLWPALGGAALGALALPFPQILGSGHGAILNDLHAGLGLPMLVALVAAKLAGSALSIGAGFRGGLFSSSLLLGSLFGNAVALLVRLVDPSIPADPVAYSLVGMGAVAAAIIGAPITMVMLVLETTADFGVTIGVMIGVVTASVVVRHGFGYSFATWRFHLRGLKIDSAEDVAWADAMTIDQLMRRDPAVVSIDLPLNQARRAHPLGSTKQLFAVDADNHFRGVLDVADLHMPDDAAVPDAPVASRLHGADDFLLAGESVPVALARFSRVAAEALPVLADAGDRRLIGYLTEAYASRRYIQELERRRGRLVDSAGIFSPDGAKG